jgi:hypothetical protein
MRCIFVINCDLQRLVGPARGNGCIGDELESLCAGAGWNVVKCLWGSKWDALSARDTRREAACVTVPASSSMADAVSRRLAADCSFLADRSWLPPAISAEATVIDSTRDFTAPIAVRIDGRAA